MKSLFVKPGKNASGNSQVVSRRAFIRYFLEGATIAFGFEILRGCGRLMNVPRANPIKTIRGIPVLLYHTVSTRPSRYNILPEDFHAQMRDLHGRGYSTVTASEFAALLKKRKTPNRTVALTFDDGYRSLYTKVFPVLKRYGLRATAFIVPSYVGTPGHVSWEELGEIAESGLVEIGSHSLTHRKLSGLKKAEVRTEMAESRRIIEKKLGVEASVFAWPYGEHDRAFDRLVAEAGYSLAFGGFAPRSGGDPLALKRWSIGGDESSQRFGEAIEPTKTIIVASSAKK